MNRDDIIKMAREADIYMGGHPMNPLNVYLRWIIHKGYATGHGDTIEDLLTELEWQVAEREREACAKVCDGWMHANGNDCAEAIRARRET